MLDNIKIQKNFRVYAIPIIIFRIEIRKIVTQVFRYLLVSRLSD